MLVIQNKISNKYVLTFKTQEILNPNPRQLIPILIRRASGTTYSDADTVNLASYFLFC